MTSTRPYTGLSDGIAGGVKPGLRLLVDHIVRETGGALWDNGTYQVRQKRGKGTMSVHATGRAADLSWRWTGNRGKPNHGYAVAKRVAYWLTDNADALGIEAVFDYFPKPYGRGWRCDRGKWATYRVLTLAGAGGGDWLHLELGPVKAANPRLVADGIKLAGPIFPSTALVGPTA